MITKKCCPFFVDKNPSIAMWPPSNQVQVRHDDVTCDRWRHFEVSWRHWISTDDVMVKTMSRTSSVWGWHPSDDVIRGMSDKMMTSLQLRDVVQSFCRCSSILSLRSFFCLCYLCILHLFLYENSPHKDIISDSVHNNCSLWH